MNNQLVLTQEGQSEAMQNRPELSCLTSSDMSISQQKTRVAFINRQEARLNALINQGHLHVGGSSLVWVDENGLLMAQDMSSELFEEPAALFHAGPYANADRVSTSFALPPSSESQDDLGKEIPLHGSLFKKLLMKELKLLPAVSHLVWKELLVDLQNSSDVHASQSVITEKVMEAISKEEEDMSELGYFAGYCADPDEFFSMDLRNLSQAMYRVAGVDITQSRSWAAFREINEQLADEVSTLSLLANKMQIQKASPEKLDVLHDIANGLWKFFDSQQGKPRMERFLMAV